MVLPMLELRTGDYITTALVKVKESEKLINAIDLMAEKKIGHLIIERKGKAVGILTEREILEIVVSKKNISDTVIKTMPLSFYTVVHPDTNVIDAAKLMIKKKTRLLVFRNEKLVGIITATDLMRALRRTKSNPKLAKFVSTTLITVKDSDDISKAVKLMHEKRVGSVIVTKRKSPYGIFTERDLLSNILTKNTDLKNPIVGYCSHPLITAAFGIGAGEAARIMAKNNIKRLVLTRQNKVLAIVTAMDIVDAFQSSLTEDL